MYRFNSDYTEGCHPEILAKLVATNMEQTDGYGIDPYCGEAADKIKTFFNCPDADVHFLVGGTQTNMTVICAALRSHQAIYGTVDAHINTHESGAIEHSGHKVIALPGTDGKLTAATVAYAYHTYCSDPSREHFPQPKMVYISQPTELGTMYTHKELTELYAFCKNSGLYLFIDGARLGYALGSPANDLSPAALASLCDVFYIGGTKCGLLFGEAVVITNPLLQPDFRTIAKQNGALLAKGRLLGVQFAAAFTNNLYIKICSRAVEQALQIRLALAAKNFDFLAQSSTNQQFVLLSKEQYAKISENFHLSLIKYMDDGRICARICTSWATVQKEVEHLLNIIERL